MKLIVIDTNFTIDKDWLFKLQDPNGNVIHIPTRGIYQKFGLKTPVLRKHLDSLDKGHVVDAEVKEIGGQTIVTSIIE